MVENVVGSVKAVYWNPRRRVYLVWALIVFFGFLVTQYQQTPTINGKWLIILIPGFLYMLKVMPLRVPKLRNIFLVWLITIAVGMIFSIGAFAFPAAAAFASLYLGVYWLFLMGIGHIANGLVDKPAREYYTSGGMQILAGIACLVSPPLLAIQYIVAAAVGGLAMVWLILYR